MLREWEKREALWKSCRRNKMGEVREDETGRIFRLYKTDNLENIVRK